MSKCISRHGEYSEHQLDQDHVCRLCHVLDEDAVVAELNRLRAERAQFDAWAEQLRYERRLLGACRRHLDEIADPEGRYTEEAVRTAADLAQRIVDEIGHSVTDEPALGPDFRERIAALKAELELLRPVVEAATEVVYCWKSGRLDHYVGIVENKLAAAVDALPAEMPTGVGTSGAGSNETGRSVGASGESQLTSTDAIRRAEKRKFVAMLRARAGDRGSALDDLADEVEQELADSQAGQAGEEVAG